MVEKIDRPDTPPAYRITEAKETKEDQHHQPDQREQMEKKYRKQLEGKEWSKFGQRSMVVRPVSAPRERIARCLYRAASIYKGMGILQVDVAWKDGRTTNGALIRLPRIEDFFRAKKLTPGQDVPEEFWAKGPTVELGIVQSIGTSEPFPAPKEKTQEEWKPQGDAATKILASLGLLNRATGRTNWGMVAFYLFMLAIVGIALYYELG